jgi:CHASE2 domain-containing sensor protein
MLDTLFITVLIVAICIALLCIGIFIKGKFPNTHVSGNKALRKKNN